MEIYFGLLIMLVLSCAHLGVSIGDISVGRRFSLGAVVVSVIVIVLSSFSLWYLFHKVGTSEIWHKAFFGEIVVDPVYEDPGPETGESSAIYDLYRKGARVEHSVLDMRTMR